MAKRGIFILYADQITTEEHILLQTAAGVIFNGERGSFASQIPDFTILPTHLPDLTPTFSAAQVLAVEPDESLPPAGPLQFFNGYGGFSPDGREYVIDLPPGRHTPAPWINVIGYPYSGFMVAERRPCSGRSTAVTA
jgi:cellobiose phosphorylase